MLAAWQKTTVGAVLLLLPFLCNPWGGEMYLQFEAPKLFGAFLFGNLCLAVVLWRILHPSFAIAHFCFALSVLLTGFGGAQLYPFAYWAAGIGFVLYGIQHKTPIVYDSNLWIWKVLVAGAVLVCLHASLQLLGITWPLQYAPGIETTRPIAMLGQQTKLGAFLAPLAAAALAIGWLPACAFISFIVLATKSSFSAFALVVGLMTVAVGRNWLRRRWLLLAVTGGLVLTVIGPRFGREIPALYDHGRHFAYADIWRAIKERPILGYGPGSFQSKFHQLHQSPVTRGMGGGDYVQAHCDYLQIPYEGGVPGWVGMLAMLMGIFYAYWKIWTRQRAYIDFQTMATPVMCASGALAAFLVNAVGNFPSTMSPHYLVAMLSAGILLRASRN